MNEVTKIHLGRQAFTIAVDAQHEIRSYLDAIRSHIHDDSVLEEVELRMAQLLVERGISGDTVILPKDVTFLKQQLGSPTDFAGEEDDAAVTVPREKPTDSKRLFRDMDNAMVAGVAAGLAQYFGVSVLIIRILFVITTFMSGLGILMYLILWLLVPEAKSSSDRLQMAGQPVTVENLKAVVSRADVPGAARRAQRIIRKPIVTLFHGVLKLLGVCLVVFGLCVLLGLVGSTTYFLLNGSTFAQESLFPVGSQAHYLLYIGVAVIGILALFIVLFGLATYRRKWPIHAWITGTLVGLLCVGLAVGGALAAVVVPAVRSSYNANIHTTTRSVPAFTSVNLGQIGDTEIVNYQNGPNYAVSLQYYGHPNLSPITTTVSDGVLTINSRGFDWQRNCKILCFPNTYQLSITITSPTAPTITGGNDDSINLLMNTPPVAPPPATP